MKGIKIKIITMTVHSKRNKFIRIPNFVCCENFTIWAHTKFLQINFLLWIKQYFIGFWWITIRLNFQFESIHSNVSIFFHLINKYFRHWTFNCFNLRVKGMKILLSCVKPWWLMKKSKIKNLISKGQTMIDVRQKHRAQWYEWNRN